MLGPEHSLSGERGAGRVLVTPQWELGPTLLDGWEMPEPVWHWQTSVPEKVHLPCAQGLSHPHGAASEPPQCQDPHRPPGCSGTARGDLLRCRFAIPFLCLIIESGLEGRGEVRAWPTRTPRPQKARHDAQPAHPFSIKELPGPPPSQRQAHLTLPNIPLGSGPCGQLCSPPAPCTSCWGRCPGMA